MKLPTSDSREALPSFLLGNSEMKDLIRGFDWHSTPLGPMHGWPQSLRTSLSIILSSKFPMFLFWGPRHICFYNDAYRPSFGKTGEGKHPFALGHEGREVFPEIWDIIGPQIKGVLTTGEANWFEDVLIPMYRNGNMEEVYWTYSMSPVMDESNTIAGVFIACNETAVKVHNQKALAESEARFRRLSDSNLLGIITWNLDGYITEANDAFLSMTGYSRQDLKRGLISWDAMTPPEWKNVTRKGLNQLETLGYFHPFEKEFFCKDGGRVFVSLGGTFYEGSKAEGVAYILDISERKKAEEIQSFRLKLNEALRGLSNPLRIQYEAASTVGVYFNADRVGYAEDYGDGKRVIVTRNYTNGTKGIEGIYNYDDYGPDLLRTLRAGRTVVRSDIASDSSLSDAEKKAHAELQLGATVNIPLLKGDQLFGIFFMHYKEPHPFTDNEIALMEETAQRTWSAVESARAEAWVRDSEEKYRTLFETMDQGFCIIEMIFEGDEPVDYLFIEANPMFEQQSGLVNVLGKTARDLVPGLEKKWFDIYGGVAQTGEAVRFIDGSETMKRWFDLYAFRVGKPMQRRVAVLFTDITTRKLSENLLKENENNLQEQVVARTKDLAEANSSLKEVNTELLRSNANLEEFAYAASHDLKEPIRKIHFFSQQLKEQLESRLTDKESRLFKRIEVATQRMGSLVDDLLLYSHVSQRPIEKEPVDLNEKVKRVMEDLEVDIQEKKAVIYVDPLPTVKGYRRQLQQMLQNLISNSIKYSKAGVPPQIHISAHEREIDGRLYQCISVADKGIGFEQEYAQKIFHMFTRLHGKSEYKGTGVGLSIVKKVVENHDGLIEVKSALGEGAVFRICLPG